MGDYPESGPGYYLSILFWFVVTGIVIWQAVGLIVALVFVGVFVLAVLVNRGLDS